MECACKFCNKIYDNSLFDYKGYCCLNHKMLVNSSNELYKYKMLVREMTPDAAYNEMNRSLLTTGTADLLISVVVKDINYIDKLIANFDILFKLREDLITYLIEILDKDRINTLLSTLFYTKKDDISHVVKAELLSGERYTLGRKKREIVDAFILAYKLTE